MQMQWLTLRKFKSKLSDVRFEAVQDMLESGDPRYFDQLVEALGDELSSTRMVAAEALGKLGDERAIDSLVATLQDDDRAVRASATRALDALGWKPQDLDGEMPADCSTATEDTAGRARIPSLVAALGHPANGMKAGIALAAIGEAAVPSLIEVLGGTDPWARHNAIVALGEIGSPAGNPQLVSLMQAGVPEAANALASIRSQDAIDSIVVALDHHRTDVRISAADALGRTGDRRVVGPLIDSARKRKSDFEVISGALGKLRDTAAIPFLITNIKRKAAADALVSIGSRATPALIEKLDSSDRDIRRGAAEALGKIGDPRAVGPLRERIGHGRHCVRALAMLDWEPGDLNERVLNDLAHGRLDAVLAEGGAAFGTLIDTFDNDDLYMRNVASTVMTRFGSGAVKMLIEALHDERIQVRARAASTLAAIGDAKAVPALIAALKSDLTLETVEALGKLGGDRAVEALLRVLRDGDAVASDRGDTRKGKKRPAHIERAAAARALGLYVQKPEVLTALIEALDDDNAAIREAALEAAGDSIDARAAESLLAMLSVERAFVVDPSSVQLRMSPAVRTAMEALARLSETRAAGAFVRIIQASAFSSALESAVGNLTYLIQRAGPSLDEEDLQSVLELPDAQTFTYDEIENGRVSKRIITADCTRVKWLASEELARRHPVAPAKPEREILPDIEDAPTAHAAVHVSEQITEGAPRIPTITAVAAIGNLTEGIAASSDATADILLKCVCGAEAYVSARFAGKKGKCKVCGEPVVVPLREEVVA